MRNRWAVGCKFPDGWSFFYREYKVLVGWHLTEKVELIRWFDTEVEARLAVRTSGYREAEVVAEIDVAQKLIEWTLAQ